MASSVYSVCSEVKKEASFSTSVKKSFNHGIHEPHGRKIKLCLSDFITAFL
jgi:hypothetical protein